MALKDKYPFINKLHYDDILTDLLNASDSNASDINALVSGYSSDDASTKKIYCHPLDIVTTKESRIGCLIFNNDSTPFTSETFVNWLENLYSITSETLRIPTTGYLYDNSSQKVYPSCLLVRKASGAAYRLTSKNENGTAYNEDYTNATVFANSISLVDGVNAIN